MNSLLQALSDPAAYPHETGEIQVVETHISWVILTGEFAYKIKKPVKLGFLNFSTLELRQYFCEEELRVNRRTAPDLYLYTVPIGAVHDGIQVGAEPAIEYAVKMRQFPYEARLDRCLQAGKFDVREACELASEIARFHKKLPPRETIDSEFEHERTIRPARNNFKHLDPDCFSDRLQQQLAVIEAWTLKLLMHGFSGSGKTWYSSRLVKELPALRVRSDLERKPLPCGPAENRTKRLDSGLYSPEVTARTYETLARHCETGLLAGFSMIADATFLQRRHREFFIEMAERNGVRVGIVDCHADKETLKERIRLRAATSTDASDADLAVLDHQLRHHDPLIETEKALVVQPLCL